MTDQAASHGRDAFREHPDQVSRFAGREIDQRLMALLPDHARPRRRRPWRTTCVGSSPPQQRTAARATVTPG